MEATAISIRSLPLDLGPEPQGGSGRFKFTSQVVLESILMVFRRPITIEEGDMPPKGIYAFCIIPLRNL